MTINWNKDEENDAISFLMKSPAGAKVGIHFENNLDESSWTFASGLDGLWGGKLPKEFIDALRKHLKDRE